MAAISQTIFSDARTCACLRFLNYMGVYRASPRNVLLVLLSNMEVKYQCIFEIYFRSCRVIETLYEIAEAVCITLVIPRGNFCQKQVQCNHPRLLTHFPPGQHGRHFADNIFICIFVNEKFCILSNFH